MGTKLIKCDGCGQKFDGSQATEIYYIEDIGEHEGKAFTLQICPNCEAKRDKAATILAWAVVIFAVISLVGFAAVVVTIKLL